MRRRVCGWAMRGNNTDIGIDSGGIFPFKAQQMGVADMSSGGSSGLRGFGRGGRVNPDGEKTGVDAGVLRDNDGGYNFLYMARHMLDENDKQTAHQGALSGGRRRFQYNAGTDTCQSLYKSVYALKLHIRQGL